MIGLLATLTIAATITGIAQFKRWWGKLCLYGAAVALVAMVVVYAH